MVMKSLVIRAKQFLQSEDGPTATEYAVMVALIAIVVIVGAGKLGASANTQFEEVSTAIDGM
jgi:pilus assembly protein Flp/PilA